MTQEALKLALEFIERVNKDGWILADFEPEMYATIIAIKEALAQPDPVATVESVATVVSESGNQEVTMSWWHEPALPVGTKLYTTPPQRTWVGLTDEQMLECNMDGDLMIDRETAKRNVEAKLKEKNND